MQLNSCRSPSISISSTILLLYDLVVLSLVVPHRWLQYQSSNSVGNKKMHFLKYQVIIPLAHWAASEAYLSSIQVFLFMPSFFFFESVEQFQHLTFRNMLCWHRHCICFSVALDGSLREVSSIYSLNSCTSVQHVWQSFSPTVRLWVILLELVEDIF